MRFSLRKEFRWQQNYESFQPIFSPEHRYGRASMRIPNTGLGRSGTALPSPRSRRGLRRADRQRWRRYTPQGQLPRKPVAEVELAARALCIRTLQKLGLDVEPVGRVGQSRGY